MHKIKYIIFAFFIYSLTACEDLSSYRGQYLGTQKFSAENEKDIVLFFNPESIQSLEDSEIIINELKASAVPEVLKLKFFGNDSMQITWKNKQRKLKLENTEPCLQASSPSESLKICFANGRIKMDFQEKKSKENILQLSVKKTKDLSSTFSENEITIDELVGRSKYANYTVQQKAEEIYRAKVKISATYGNLLPRLNLGDVLSFVVDGPLGFIEAIGNFIPFIFPSNWYRFAQTKDLHQAELKSYASLRGNEMQAVESLSYLHLRNIEISNYMNQEIVWLKEIQNHLEMREKIGDVPQGTSLLLAMKIGNLALDKEQLDLYIQSENSLIAHSIASPIAKSLKLTPVARMDLSRSEKVTADNCVKQVSQKSHEVASLTYMIKASQNQNLENQYSFLDPSSDGVLGVGTPSMIRMGKSHINELKVRQKEIISLLQKGCVDSVNERNNSIQTYSMSVQYLKQANSMKNILSQKIILEGNFSSEILLELISNSENIIKFKSQALTSETQFRASESKLNRLMLSGFYKNLEVGL